MKPRLVATIMALSLVCSWSPRGSFCTIGRLYCRIVLGSLAPILHAVCADNADATMTQIAAWSQTRTPAISRGPGPPKGKSEQLAWTVNAFEDFSVDDAVAA